MPFKYQNEMIFDSDNNLVFDFWGAEKGEESEMIAEYFLYILNNHHLFIEIIDELKSDLKLKKVR